MANTNVELSKNEMELVTNADFILTKNRIIDKAYNLFGLLSEVYKEKLKPFYAIIPAEVYASSPKIYKGENYLGLPYVMMDYPRVFTKDDVFAVRSFFWWGNYFSQTLQCSGKYMQHSKNNIEKNLKVTAQENFSICVNHNQWDHHFEANNYKPVKDIDPAEVFSGKSFIKIAKQHSLADWNNAAVFFENSYIALLKLIVD